MIHHGGNLFSVANQYQSEPHLWLDLSTGVSPFSYPIPVLPQACWHHLPQNEDGLQQAASQYYLKYPDSDAFLPLAGSQAAIMAVPSLLLTRFDEVKDRVVLLPRVGYKEHEKAWVNACLERGISYEYYDLEPTREQRERAIVLLVINTNNPMGHTIPKKVLSEWHNQIKQIGGYLVVDEAFIDLVEDNSLLPYRDDFDNLIVLRSLGKFFGLAGLRVGFIFLEPKLKVELESQLGPWTVSGASRYIARCALQDNEWQVRQREKIRAITGDIRAVLTKHFPKNKVIQAPLFFRVEVKNATQLYDLLCQQQILVRLCDEGDAVRLGLVANQEELLRLDEALKNVC